MIIRSGWVQWHVIVPPKHENERHTFRLRRVRVEIDLRDCAHIGTAMVSNILANTGIKPRRRIIYHAEKTRPLRADGQRLVGPIELPISTSALVQIRLDSAARAYFMNLGDMRWSPRRDAAAIEKFQRHVLAAAKLFEFPPRFFLFNRSVAPVLRGLLWAQSDDLLDRAEALFPPLSRSKQRSQRRKAAGGPIFIEDVYCLRAALNLLADYAKQASKNAKEELQKTPNQAFKNEGRGALNHYVRNVCLIWRDDLRMPIATSVTEKGSAAGPLVRYVRKAMEAIGVRKTMDATRALIRRVMKAELKKTEIIRSDAVLPDPVKSST
jgi:hypothetical protein